MRGLSVYEMIQITVEAFAVILCLVSSLILIANGLNNVTKNLLWLFIANTVVLAVDCMALFFSGNTDLLSLGVTRAAYLISYSLEVVLLFLSVKLLYEVLHDAGIATKRVFGVAVGICSVIAEVILLVNQGTGCMYTFSADNYLMRTTGWYVYAGILGIGLFIEIGLVLSYGKHLSDGYVKPLMVYCLIPCFSVLLQTLVPMYSFANVGVSFGLLVILFSYLKKWMLLKSKRGEASLHERTLLSTGIIFFITIVCMTSSIVNCVLSIQTIAHDNSKQEDLLLVQTVEDHVTKELLKPMTVAKTMTKDTFFIDMLVTEEDKDIAEPMSAYLSSIREEFGYPMVYVASERSRKFYTYNGVARQISRKTDYWYYEFLENNRIYETKVDTDELSKGKCVIFVNGALYADNRFLGICGVGIDLSSVQDLIYKYEKKYEVSILLTDANGLVQIANDNSLVLKEKLDTGSFQEARLGDGFIDNANGIRIIKYIEDLDWYIVVSDEQPNRLDVQGIIFPSILIFSFGLLVMVVVFWMIYQSEKKARRELFANRIFSNTDELTSLYNRHAYEEDRKMIKATGRIPEIIVLMMDLNGLKYVNDNIGHDAGDRLLMGAADCMQEAFSKYGRVYRTGGDEFVALLYCNRNQIEMAMEEFDAKVDEWNKIPGVELSVSRGIAVAVEHPQMDIKELEKLADKHMYEDKNEYYKRTGKDRRVGY